MINKKINSKTATAITLTIIGLIGYLYFQTFSMSGKIERLSSELASTTVLTAKKIDELNNAIAMIDQKTTALFNNLSATDKDIQNTKKNVEAVQSQVGGVEQTVGKITGAVSTLEKLSKTDPELLQKYSKVFFLNEHYTPERLQQIDAEYLYSEKRAETIHSLVWPHLKDLLESAKKVSVALYVKSAYRSFDEQKAVKTIYTVVYGKGNANTFSADQGYSEHQLGTTIDFTAVGINGSLNGFEKMPAYLWVQINAHKYGFVLSYPENNDYYIFEPWHWRYVGVALATRLKEEGKYFYDLEQREIDKYLPNIFD